MERIGIKISLISACKKIQCLIRKRQVQPDSYRVAKSEKAELTCVNEHFYDKRNAEIGVFLQTLIRVFAGLLYILIYYITLPVTAKAQDPVFSQTYAGYLYINPGFAGSIGEKKISLSYRNQWPGNLTKYETFYASYDQPVELLHGGIGVFMSNDRIGAGFTNNFNISAIYAYHLQVLHDFFVHAGFQVSFNQRKIDVNNLIFPDMINPSQGIILPTQEVIGDGQKIYMDYSVGFIGYSGNWFGGVAIFHLTKPSLSNSEVEGASLARKLSVHLARNFILNQGSGKKELWTVTPEVLYNIQKKMMYLSYGVVVSRNPVSLGVYTRHDLQFDFSTMIFAIGFSNLFMDFTYSYDVYIGQRKINPFGGAHEVSISFRLPYGKKREEVRTINIPGI